jgi:hypothetical protein
VKDPIEVLPPTGNRIFIVLRTEELRNRVSFTLLVDLALDLGHGSAIKTSGQWIIRRAHRLSNSRSKLSDGPEHGLAEFI